MHRHLLTFSQPVKFSDEFEEHSQTRWFHVMPAGTYFERDGEKTVYNYETLAKIVENAKKYATPLSIDYDHQTVNADRKSGPIETAGWVLDIEMRSDGIWALGKFTSKAADLIKSGSYSFCSPVIERDSIDRLTGKKVANSLWNIALTPNPFLDGQQAIRMDKLTMDNRAPKKVTYEFPQDTPPVAPASVQPAAPAAAAPAKAETMADTPPPAEGDAPPPEAPPEDGGGDGQAVLTAIAEAVGVDMPTLLDMLAQNADSIATLLKGGSVEQMACSSPKKQPMSKELAIKDEQLVALSKRIEVLEAEKKAVDDEKKAVQLAKVTARVDELLGTGYLVPTMRADALEIYSADWDKGERLFAQIKIAPTGSEPQSKTDPKVVIPRIDKLSKSQLDAVNMLKGIKINGKLLYNDEAALVNAVAELDK